MDFEKEAREIAQFVWGDTEYVAPPDEIAFIVAILRRAYAAGQENMKEAASYIAQGWEADENLYAIDVARRDSKIVEAIMSIPVGQHPKVNEFTPLATTKDIGLE